MKKAGRNLARSNPETEKICTGKDLAEAFDHVALTVKEARAWHKDLVAGRKALNPQKDKW